MGRARRIAASLAAVALAACSGGDVPVETSRAPIVTTTTVGDEAPASEPPAPEAPEAVGLAQEGAEDPALAGTRRSSRAGAGSSRAGTSPTGHIEIPAIGLSHATFEGVDLSVINRGPSHWPGTPLPGERGNTVFPGHRTTYSRPFWDIDKLTAGDEVIFTTPAGRFTYRVTETFVVGWRERWILQNTDKATFTIFACHPRGSARQRYVAKGELVSEPATTTTTTTAPPRAPATTTTTAPPEEERRRGLLGLPG